MEAKYISNPQKQINAIINVEVLLRTFQDIKDISVINIFFSVLEE